MIRTSAALLRWFVNLKFTERKVMKLSLLVTGLLLIGCSGGPSSDPPSDPVVETTPSKPAPKPAPTQDSDPIPAPDNHCVVVIDWINDCEVIKVYCYGKLKDLDIKCGGGRIIFPWQYIPDPPPPWVDHGSNRK